MKTYNEVADSIFKRREEYVAEKKKKKTNIVRLTSTLACFCLVALFGIGLWQRGLPRQPADSVTASSSLVNTQIPNKNVLPYTDNDSLGWLILDGKLYVQDGKLNGIDMETDQYVGIASEYEGLYKNISDVNGEVYTVKGEPDALYIRLSNGGSVVLRYEKKVN